MEWQGRGDGARFGVGEVQVGGFLHGDAGGAGGFVAREGGAEGCGGMKGGGGWVFAALAGGVDGGQEVG